MILHEDDLPLSQPYNVQSLSIYCQVRPYLLSAQNSFVQSDQILLQYALTQISCCRRIVIRPPQAS